jgi:uncharacterized membrane protein YphA (DoxX/SURF4 family)
MKSVGLALLIPGVLLFGFGAVDLLGSFGGFDVWEKLGVELPGVLWSYSAYIELIAGAALVQQGRSRMAPDEDDE